MGVDGFHLVVDDVAYDFTTPNFENVSPNLHLTRQFLEPLARLDRPYYVVADTYQLQGWMQGSINSLIYGTHYPTFGDITTFFDPTGTQTNTINLLDFYAGHSFWIKPGCYFDPTGILNGTQGTWANFGLGAMRRSEGIYAMLCLTKLEINFDVSVDYHQVKTNHLLCKIHQDPLVIPAHVVASNSPMECLYRPLSDGKGAIAFYNRSFAPNTSSMIVGWTNLGLAEGNYLFTDVWTGQPYLVSSNSFGVTITNDTFALYYIEPLTTAYPINLMAPIFASTTFANGSIFTTPTTYGLPISSNGDWIARWWLPIGTTAGDRLIYDLQYYSTNSTPSRFAISTELYQADNTHLELVTYTTNSAVGAKIFDLVCVENIGTTNWRNGWFNIGTYAPVNGGNTNTVFFSGGAVYRTKQ